MKKEQYEKPEIKAEELEISSFGSVAGPIQYLQPNFGICCD
jgi:hypothetical protein